MNVETQKQKKENKNKGPMKHNACNMGSISVTRVPHHLKETTHAIFII